MTVKRSVRREVVLALGAALVVGGGAARADQGADAFATLGWPASTKSAQTRGQLKVFVEPRGRGGTFGEIGPGVRLDVTEVVASKDRCQAWLHIAPRGWICAADTRASDEPPIPTERPRHAGRALLGEYADIRSGGADAFDSVTDVRVGQPRERLSSAMFVVLKAPVTVDGERYYRTDQGLVASERLMRKTASEFAGVDLVASPPPTWPMGWASPHEKKTPLVVRDRPSADGAIVETLAKHAIIPILGRQGDFVQVGEGEWIDARDTRIARTTAPPWGVLPDERWIDVDLEEQVLVAYEGTRPVFATLVATAGKKFVTPVGVWRIGDKDTKRRMRNSDESRASWNVADVPFVMGFRKWYALHGAYWHDGFGRPRSHGCVNLSPADAQEMFGWTRPAVPAGWTFVEDDGHGTPIRIRNSRHPTPSWRGMEGEILGPSTPPATGA